MIKKKINEIFQKKNAFFLRVTMSRESVCMCMLFLHTKWYWKLDIII